MTFNDDDFLEYFSSIGDVHCVEVKLNKRGHCRGYGFVTFSDDEVAENVISFDHHEVSVFFLLLHSRNKPHLLIIRI